MSVFMFQVRLGLLREFSNKLLRSRVPVPVQKAMIKEYAKDLKLTLTDQMASELMATLYK